MDLQTCCKTLCFNKYTRSQFLSKESAIRNATEYQNEFAQPLDFVMLYIRMVKWSAFKEIELSAMIIDFMSKVEKIAKKFAKFALVDAGMVKYKPSIMGATFVFLGFQLQFETD